MLEQINFQFSRLKTEFRYSIWVNLQRSYPKNIDEIEAIFIHIPKTAGTSLYNLIGYTGIGHVTYRWYESRDPDKFDRYFKFAFVRNPWDRLVSAFIYLKNGGSNAMDKHWAEKNIARYTTFHSFVENWVNETNIETYFHLIPQYKFICDENLGFKMNYIGKFENLNDDFEYVSKKLKLSSNLPCINQSKRRAYQEYYTPETKAIVERVYENDIKLFEYKFE